MKTQSLFQAENAKIKWRFSLTSERCDNIDTWALSATQEAQTCPWECFEMLNPQKTLELKKNLTQSS